MKKHDKKIYGELIDRHNKLSCDINKNKTEINYLK
jgi:hypothetical protein